MPFGKLVDFSFFIASSFAAGVIDSRAEVLIDLGKDAAPSSGEMRKKVFIDCRGQ